MKKSYLKLDNILIMNIMQKIVPNCDFYSPPLFVNSRLLT